MNEKRILEIFGNIREEYIYEANPWKRKKHRFRINSAAAAACICFLFISILNQLVCRIFSLFKLSF